MTQTLLVVLLFWLCVGLSDGASDPCSSYTTLGEQWRNVGFRYYFDKTAHCDQPGGTGGQGSYDKWFRFSGYAGNMMPEKCPPLYSCGTLFPIWLNGKHPTLVNDVVTREACSNWGGQCCYSSYSKTIKIKLCPGNFYVYFLPQVVTCGIAYCAVHSCSVNNGECSHICKNVAYKDEHVCDCPKDMVLMADKRTCAMKCTMKNGGCSHECVDTKYGAQCRCPAGLKLSAAGKHCVATSVSPCLINNGGCSHYCQLSKSGPVCSCSAGLVLQKDNKNCVKPCDVSSINCSHTCSNTRDGQAVCSCPQNMVLAPDKMTCTQSLKTGYKCHCSISVEESGTNRGPSLFDLPTLVYGFKDLWAEDVNGTFKVLDRFPQFRSVRRKRQIPSHIDALKCLDILQNCPRDCERLAKVIIDDDLATLFPVVGSLGYKLQPLGHIMCDKLLHSLHPGKRPVVFYDPGKKCGSPMSTHALPYELCCSSLKIPGVIDTIIWNKKCADKVSIKDLIEG